MISVREAKAIPRPDGIEWRNKYICVEGSFPTTLSISYPTIIMVLRELLEYFQLIFHLKVIHLCSEVVYKSFNRKILIKK